MLASDPECAQAAGSPQESNGSDSAVGEAICRACHALEALHWNDTLHAEVFLKKPRNALERRTCGSCHGPGREHLADPMRTGGLRAFTRKGGTPVSEQNAACLRCHAAGARLHWPGSAHAVEGLGCSDCHNPMSRTSARGLLRERTPRETCFTCHPAQRLQFRKRSHMPLSEAKIECGDCHEPHGSVTDPLLRGDSVNQTCYRCHADKRGPFLWEHAPVVESCLNCHRPHGSNRSSLLTTSIPFLCQQCHAQVGIANHPTQLTSISNLAEGLWPDDRIVNRGCVNCHVQIHGSNHPSGARFHR